MSYLVVEDDDMYRDLLVKVLAPQRVHVAKTMAEAFAFLAVETVDTLIVDLHLPDSTDTQTLGRIKELQVLAKGAAIIIITGAASIKTQIEGLRQGAFAVLEKDTHFFRDVKTLALHAAKPGRSEATLAAIERAVLKIAQPSL